MPTNGEPGIEAVPALRRPMDRRQFMRRAAVVGGGAADALAWFDEHLRS